MSPPDFTFGDIVHDRDDDDPNDAVVVNVPPTTADEWDVPAIQKTVAEDNPDYPPDADVIVVVFRDELEETIPNWTDRDEAYTMQELNEAGVPHYSFPAPRLTHADQEDPSEAVGETNREAVLRIEELKARLDDAAWETELVDSTLTVAKLGETYRIHDNGEIDGDGHLRDSLGNIVAQYTE